MDPLAAAACALANPFEPDADRGAAGATLDELAARPGAALEPLIARGARKAARRLLVALATRDGGRALEPRALPERLFTELGLPRAAVRDIAAAAARVAEGIARLAGVSAAVRRLRAATWRACFGASLYEAIRLRPLIRDQNVLILGETGTGKELVAQAIALADPQPERLQVVNAAAIPRELLEAELFGHARGAFTGAVAEREGRLVAAAGGTLFLDEIAELPAELQAKLLRAIEDDRVTPLGSNRAQRADVRTVGATAQPIAELVERGAFRRDLYERVAGVVLVIPPLRERLEDLQPIADALCARAAEQLGAPAGEVGASTAQLGRLTVAGARFRAWLGADEARARPWRGNVRELACLLRSFVLGFEQPAPSAPPAPAAAPRLTDGRATLREVEDWYIQHVLERVGFRQTQAAEILGIDRGTLARRLRQIDAGATPPAP